MKKVAIVFYRGVESSYDWDGNGTEMLVASQITDWTEVSEDDYRLLCSQSTRRGFNVVHYPENQKEYIKKTVDDVLAEIEKEKKKREEEQAEKKRRAAERAAKKLAKSEKDRRALFEQLQKEFQQ